MLERYDALIKMSVVPFCFGENVRISALFCRSYMNYVEIIDKERKMQWIRVRQERRRVP